MAAYVALKPINYDNQVLPPGESIPETWVSEWESLDCVRRMLRHGQIGYVGAGTAGRWPISLSSQTVVPGGGDGSVGPDTPAGATTGEANADRRASARGPVESHLDSGSEGGGDSGEAVDSVDVPVDDDATEEGTEGESFDPADHNIADVKDFVNENPDLAADVLDAERQGRNRVSLINWLDELVTDLEGD